MKFVIGGLVKRLLFWMLFFALLRLVFLVYYNNLITLAGISFQETLKVFWHALALDLSTAGYVLLISYILLIFNEYTKKSIFLKIDKYFTLAILLVYSLITSAELGLFGEWNTKLSYKALNYLKHPDEVFNSISTGIFFLIVAIWLLQAFVPYYCYRCITKNEIKHTYIKKPSVWLSLIFIPFLLFLAIRGGLGSIPISTSSAYFSSHQILNLAAVNSGNNMILSTLNSISFGDVNPFETMPEQEAKSIVDRMHQVEGDSTIGVLNIKQPNIVVLLLESWSGDLIESLGGEAGITPNFRNLEKDGLLFTNFYASGNRSQQAIASLYAGMPGLPVTTITAHPEKYAVLPSFIKDIKQQGYHTSFWFGGELIYGNILSYLMYNEFDAITEGKDLSSDFPRGKLGVHDEYLLEHVAEKLNDYPQPFLSTVFTLSSHSPYDFPMGMELQWPQIEKEFVNSAHYTDYALGLFFKMAKQQNWYQNTLFVIVADHSHKSYRNYPLESFEYHKIPLMLCGPALKEEFRGTKFDKIAGNTDIPASLMAQLGMDHSKYYWSKNVFNTHYKPFAFFELDGFGFMRPEGSVVWDSKASRYYQNNASDSLSPVLVNEGKAYLQVLFGDFIKY